MSVPRHLDGLRILVAEDDAANLDVATQMLTQLGAVVTAARNGVTALERITQDRPDVVLLDIEMPEMSGLDVLRTIAPSANRPTIICLTAHVEQDYLDRVSELGADGTIGKPLRSIERLGLRILEIHHGGGNGGDVPVLDMAIYDMLAKAMGPDMIGGLITQLGSDLNLCNATLAQAVEDRALDAVRAQTHILTGVAGSVGASRLAVLSAQLNSAAHEGDTIALRGGLPRLQAEIDALMLRLKQG